MADRSHIDVRARLIWLGLERQLVSIFLVDVVFTKIVDRFPQALHCFIRTPAGIRLNALAPSPQDKNRGTQFGPKVHCAHRFLQSVGPDFGIVCRKGPVSEDGMKEQRDSSHRND